jgi:MULE transposase domain
MLWVTVDGTGATKVLASSLLLDETADSMAWSCQCFKDCFRVPPRVIFSDSAPAIKLAVASVFPEPHTLHFLCIWHLSKNMLTALVQAVGQGGDLWSRVRSAWWRIAKQSNKNSDWDTEWAELLALVETGTGSDAAKATACEWLEARGADKERWAYRYTWRHRTLGIHSTQRIEAVHSAVDHFLGPNRLLTDLLSELDSYTDMVDLRTATRDLRFHARLVRAAAACMVHPFITQLAGIGLSAYATVLVKAQLQQEAFYRVEEKGNSADGAALFAVSRTYPADDGPSAPGTADDEHDADVGLSTRCLSGMRFVCIPAAADAIVTCSCQYQDCYGLPCRHIMRAMCHLQRPLPTRGIDGRWIQRTQEQQNAAVLALLARQPPARADAAGPSQPSRDECFALVMATARGLAETARMSPSAYEVIMAGLATLHDNARRAVTGQHGAAATRGQVQAAAAGGGAAPQGRQCRGCWGFGHNRSNRVCPRHGLSPLPQPEVRGASGPARVVRRGLGRPSGDESDGEGSDASATPSESGANDNVCHMCSSTGTLFCCDGCHRSWHPLCVEGIDSVHFNGEDTMWLCPVCTGSWASAPVGDVGNPPRARPGRGGNQRERRKRPHTEESPPARKRSKRAGRVRETRYR